MMGDEVGFDWIAAGMISFWLATVLALAFYVI
jgi:hypothetical protein